MKKINVEQIMNKKRLENLSWEEVAAIILDTYNIQDCWIDPNRLELFKLYSAAQFTKQNAILQFEQDTKHLSVYSINVWGSERFGVVAHDYKISFKIRGTK